MDEGYLEMVVFFLCRFCFNNCYSSTEMISFIKFFPVIRSFLLQRMLLKYYAFVAWLYWCWVLVFLTDSAWIFVGVFFLGRRRVVFFLVHFSLCCCVEYYLLRCFHIARHLAAKFGTRLAAFSVYVFFAMGRWFTTGIDAVSFVFRELLIIR